MGSFVTHHFLFTTEIVTPLELDNFSGSALRGNLFDGVWRRFCTNKASPTCAECMLHTTCPVSALVAPLREENPHGRDIPRPYIILPPLGDARRYAPRKELLFGITLFGTIVQLLPYIMLTIDTLESAGLGRKVQENHCQRGRFKIKRIDSYHPLRGERQLLYENAKPFVNVPTLSITEADVQAKAATLPTDKITLNFLTPTRLIDKNHLVRQAQFRPLIQRLLERLTALEDAYGTSDEQTFDERRKLIELAEQVQCVDDTTRWEELESYSNRQKRFTPIGGILGCATFAGDLTPFREFLVWGELIHVGKNCVKGDGWYTIAQ